MRHGRCGQGTGDQSLIAACVRLFGKMCLGIFISPEESASRAATRASLFAMTYPENAYCETRAIGLVLWNHRLLQLHGDARFADVMERGLYNGISGVSLSGDRFLCQPSGEPGRSPSTGMVQVCLLPG